MNQGFKDRIEREAREICARAHGPEWRPRGLDADKRQDGGIVTWAHWFGAALAWAHGPTAGARKAASVYHFDGRDRELVIAELLTNAREEIEALAKIAAGEIGEEIDPLEIADALRRHYANGGPAGAKMDGRIRVHRRKDNGDADPLAAAHVARARAQAQPIGAAGARATGELLASIERDGRC